jgi:hypothetical protein
MSDGVIDEILGAVAACGRTPSDEMFGALARASGRSEGWIRERFELLTEPPPEPVASFTDDNRDF